MNDSSAPSNVGVGVGGRPGSPSPSRVATLTRARPALILKLTFAASLVVALFVSALDPHVAVAIAAVFVAASVGLDYWVYRAAGDIPDGKHRRGVVDEKDAAGRDPLAQLFEALMSGASTVDGIALDDIRSDLGRIGDLNNQLARLADLARELDTALPYEETKAKVLRLARQILSADVVALVSERGGAFSLEGVDGCEAAEVDVDCCGYYSRCPVRSTFRNQSFACVPDHSCAMFPLTLRSQLSLPFALADGERTVALVAAAARTHAFDEISPILFERLALHVHAALSQALTYDRIRREVVSDALTGLYNRRFFEQQAHEEIQRSIRDHIPVSVVMLDIDHFGLVNDGYGTLTGDRVLQSVARHLKENVRESDICARYGGEEFALLLPDTPGGSAVHMAERLRRSVAQLMHTGLGLPSHVSVTVSGGIAACPRDATEVQELIHRAQRALRDAKRQGRNQIARAGLEGTRGPTTTAAASGALEVVPPPEQQSPHRGQPE